jgi:hypothetical protein
MVEDRIKLQQYLKRPIKNMARMVQSLVYSSDRLWCLISDTPNVIEIDVDKRLPTYIFTMDEFPKLEVFDSDEGILIFGLVSGSGK